MARRKTRDEYEDYLEEREARIQEIIARARHHQSQADKYLAEVKRLKAALKAAENRPRRKR